MLNLGIIGFGGIARGFHVPLARESGRFFIKAAADVIDSSAFAKELDIPEFYTDYNVLLKDPSIDAVLVASPHDVHEENCVAAFNAGKHVLIEKPISRNLKEAENIIHAAEKAGTVGMVGFCQRFYTKHAYIKEKIDSNAIGKLLNARADHYQNFNPAQDSWWRNAERAGGGAVIGSGVHRLDLLRWYLGEPISVYAKAVKAPHRLEAEACVHSVIEFDSGAIANFTINWASYNYLYWERFEVTGENGLMVVGPGDVNKISLAEVDNGILKDMVLSEEQENMYTHFADCIENNKTPLTSLDEGYKTQRLVRAIYKSIETGEVIDPKTVTF